MDITEEGFGNAVRMCEFVDKEYFANIIGDLAKQMMLAMTTAFIAEFTFTGEGT